MDSTDWYIKKEGESIFGDRHDELPDGSVVVYGFKGRLPDQIQGPFTLEQLKDKARFGHIVADTMLCNGTKDWDKREKWNSASCFLMLVREMPVNTEKTYRYGWTTMPPWMKQLLCGAAVTGVVMDPPESASLTLIEQGLWDDQNRLTKEGRVLAISLCPLKKQCEALGVPHQIWRLPKQKKPEFAVMDAIKKSGYWVSFSEGGAFDLLLRNLNTLQSWQTERSSSEEPISDGYWREYEEWTGINRGFILALFRSLGHERWATISRRVLTDPNAPGIGAGWPDLIWVEGSRIGLIEVKTTDRLLISQIIAFDHIRNLVQVPIQVIEVQWVMRNLERSDTAVTIDQDGLTMV